jgi:integral membrane protein
MIYLVVTFDLSQKMRWAPKRMLTLMVAGTIPLASFFAEKKAVAEVHASGKLESAAPAGV